MPGTRITLTRNSRQTVRSAVVLDLDASNPEESIRSILAAAEKKLRIKKPQRLFLAADGTEIGPATLSRVANDAVVLVSAGEGFVGGGNLSSKDGDQAPAAAVSVVHSSERFLEDFVERLAINQLEQVARLPGVVMPDLHPSDHYPIGAAIESEECIYPVLIGGDVGCGMALFQTTLSSSTRPKRICDKLQGIEGRWKDGSVSEWLAKNGISGSSSTPFDESLGTIGGGNHFAEIQQVERVEDPESFSALGLHEDKLVLLVHSGSRGLGKHIAHSQPVQLRENTAEFDAYMQQHNYACNWARTNRDLIAHRIMACLSSDPDASASKVLDIWHNNVTNKEIDSRSVWLHRKGAAPSDQGAVVIPGSRGSFSYLVMPVGDQRENSFSLAHGAGRSLTRGVALSRMKNKASTVNAAAAALQETRLGGRVICEDVNLLFEEAPEAYKDVDVVVGELVGCGIIKVVAVYRPVVTYKKRSE
ncbi:uncharacterized protein LOC9649069 [Selaginella moellendorffii]|nr:uncharacterized protein LOC9649069 [Selaginella moellendorffii]|eukprot:XP_002984977.2 uncharacterized protein LOC9649069 [Selaginella moellendorffii]